MTLSITTICHNAECLQAECRDLFIVMLNVIMPSVVILCVVMLSVVAPIKARVSVPDIFYLVDLILFHLCTLNQPECARQTV
jgi:hypothetical protein